LWSASLKVHHETRTLPVYALVVAKGGPKVTASKPQPNDPDGMPGNPGVLNTSLGKETGRGALIEFLAEDLSDALGRKVVDKTGLTGRYDFTLTWARTTTQQRWEAARRAGRPKGHRFSPPCRSSLGSSWSL
jgi:uncharacterized protein (TIGR03435 family)